jgi:hypothetical protein
LRSRFWEPGDLAGGLRDAVCGLDPEWRVAAAWWWSMLATADQSGPRMYAAAFVRATHKHDSDWIRWSLLAILRDQVQRAQLFRLAMQYLTAERPHGVAPGPTPGQAERHLAEVHQEAERCWRGYQQALDRSGLAVVTGGLLLDALVAGDLYQHCAVGCGIPTFATAFRHLLQDAQRHQDALRALASWDWPRLSTSQRAEAAAQVQAMARFLSRVMLDPEDDPGTDPVAACREGLGVPSREQRLEVLRAALLNVKIIEARYGLPFPAMPHLAIPGSGPATRDRHEGEEPHAGL